ncbi:MAG: MotA/TolQ/ExbB proton channel family protein [Candidatus Omnitrophica bacterium]|nr:MotA/TolQ/ExbB proton channel family protein [Candidatus Omnitrophota bacterium]
MWMISRAGPIGYVIILSSVVGLAVFIERFIRIYQVRIDTDRFLKEISYWLSERNVGEALRLCERIKSPVSRVVRTGLLHIEESKDRLTNRLENVALIELPRLESRMDILATVVCVAPLLGFLGTVTGMIQAFQVIEMKTSYVTPSDLAKGIWEALLTTALGLMVAVPFLLAHGYLRNIIQGIRIDMERAATLVLDFSLSRDEIPVSAREYQHQT